MGTNSGGQDFVNAPNLRDLGGFPAAGGRTVRRGLVFRSDALSELSEEEIARLAELGIRAVVDFRGSREARFSPDLLPPTVVHEIAVPIDADALMANFYGGTLNRRKATGLMVCAYRRLATDFAPCYGLFFAALADADKTPLLFHCAAGKDRTGFAAALFLSSLGVDRRLIAADYLLSAERLGGKYEPGVDYDETTEPLYTVLPEFIAAAFEVVDGFAGGVEGYLRDRLGVDAGRMREMFTE